MKIKNNSSILFPPSLSPHSVSSGEGASRTIEMIERFGCDWGASNTPFIRPEKPLALWLAPDMISMAKTRKLLQRCLQYQSKEDEEYRSKLIESYQLEPFRGAYVIGDECLCEVPRHARFHAQPGRLLSKMPIIMVSLAYDVQWNVNTTDLASTLGVSDIRFAFHSGESKTLFVAQIHPAFFVYPEYDYCE
jgi:hypothetical protein